MNSLAGGSLVDGTGAEGMRVERSVLLRTNNDTSDPVLSLGQSNGSLIIRSHFEISLPSPPNFRTLILADNSDNTRIEDSVFRMNPSAYGETQHGVIARNTSGISIVDNYFEHVQAKIAGPLSSGSSATVNAIVAANEFFSPYNFAVSAVSNNPQDIIRGLIIRDNIVTNIPSKGAFYVGTDGDINQTAELSDVIVSGNIIRGTWNGSGAGIKVSLALLSEEISIRDNIISSDSGQADARAIDIDRTNNDNSVRGLTLTGNQVGGSGGWFKFEAIRGVLLGEAIMVTSNNLDSSRGVQIFAGGDGLLIADNYVRARGNGVELIAYAGGTGITNALVSNNIIESDNQYNFAVKRTSNSLPYNVYWHGNLLEAYSGSGYLWSGSTSSGETCRDNLPLDCP